MTVTRQYERANSPRGKVASVKPVPRFAADWKIAPDTRIVWQGEHEIVMRLFATAISWISGPGLNRSDRAQRGEQRLGRQFGGAHVDPAAERVLELLDEVSVVGGIGEYAPPARQQHIADVPAIATIIFLLATLVVDLDGVRRLYQQGVLWRQRIPGGMRDADERACGGGTSGKFGATLLLGWRREVGWQANGEQMPERPGFKARGVQFSAQQRREVGRVQRADIGDGIPNGCRKWSESTRKS